MAEHEYLMGIQRYFCGEERFMVTAASKAEAIEKAKQTPFYRSGEVWRDTLRCVRKLKPSFGKDGAGNGHT